jgi:hypothetical protein
MPLPGEAQPVRTPPRTAVTRGAHAARGAPRECASGCRAVPLAPGAAFRERLKTLVDLKD